MMPIGAQPGSQLIQPTLMRLQTFPTPMTRSSLCAHLQSNHPKIDSWPRGFTGRGTSCRVDVSEGEDEWSFEGQLRRSTAQLKLDLKKVEKAQDAREAMSITAERKKSHGRISLYGKSKSKADVPATASITHKMATSHAIDIVHGLMKAM